MHTTNLRKVGGSVMLTIPPALLELLRLQAGASVGLSIEDGHLIVHPRPSPTYRLSDLLAQCDPKAPRGPDEQEWLDAPTVGNELL